MAWGRHLLMAAAVILACTGPLEARGEEPFPPLFEAAQPFLRALQQSQATPLAEKITGLTVPHHLLAADLIADACNRVAGQGYERIIILSPDHYARSRTPFAVARRDFQTVLGPVGIDAAAVAQVLQNNAVSASNLFSHEHGVQALLPFVVHHFPQARIIALAIRNTAKQPDWDALAETLAPLVTPQTLIIQSTDFSHYLSAAQARSKDQETLRILSGGEPEGVLGLREPEHLDSKAAQYLQLRLQRRIFQARPTVFANRNSQEYTTGPLAKTTSYIVQLYSAEKLPVAGAARYCFAGDTFLGRYLAARLAQGRFQENLAAKILQFTRGAGLIVNLEGVLQPTCRKTAGPYDLGMRTGLALPLLKRLNVQVVSLANNHSRDFGPAAYRQMVRTLTRAGITPLENGDIKELPHFQLAAFTDVDNQAPQKTARLRQQDVQKLETVRRDKPLVAFLHWGQEYTSAAGPREEALISVLQAQGVELIIGCHTHQAGPLVCRQQNCLAFSLGNFIFDQNRPGISGAMLEMLFFPQGTYFLRWHLLGNLYTESAAPEERLPSNR
jgi:AmmeMemoRadiSam system protein B